MQQAMNMILHLTLASLRKAGLIFLVLGALTSGCNREAPGAPGRQQHLGRTYTKAELNKLILPGMSAAELTNRFGIPGIVAQISQEMVLWTYSFPVQLKKRSLHLAGFSVQITNESVAAWSPVMEESVNAGADEGSADEQPFEIFLATDSLTNIAHSVDLSGSADAPLQASPYLAFKAKVFAGNTGKEQPGEQTVILVLSEHDAFRMQELSENNFGKRLLIVYRNRVIAAPVISVPLVSRQLMFTSKDQAFLDEVY